MGDDSLLRRINRFIPSMAFHIMSMEESSVWVTEKNSVIISPEGIFP